MWIDILQLQTNLAVAYKVKQRKTAVWQRSSLLNNLLLCKQHRYRRRWRCTWQRYDSRHRVPDITLDTGKFLYGDVIKWKHFPRYWPFVRWDSSATEVLWINAFKCIFKGSVCIKLALHADYFGNISSCVKRTFNSFFSNVAYIHRWTESALVQVMACRLFGANPLPEPMLAYGQMTLGNKFQWNLNRYFIGFIAEDAFQNAICQNGYHFVQEDELTKSRHANMDGPSSACFVRESTSMYLV